MTIYLKGFEVLIDKQDLPLIDRYTWYIGNGYVMTQKKRKTIYLHRLIAGVPANMHTDHINRNKLDNRRRNLRICTPGDNNRNKPPRSSTGHKYIYKDSDSRPFTVQYKRKTLGRFEELSDAVTFVRDKLCAEKEIIWE